ncbi:hypothetical protein SKAU_G00323600 [Synaphobranchus kaupii]|uniref:Uncharacterized protein n=1 Tax=Synaphobranchus kaupii TaxID=118154 RepID=A0A9Q1EP76_SYNKA|nr:hypothetical protein SKAU_G00323600 [Synaphobranchus kaupii]
MFHQYDPRRAQRSGLELAGRLCENKLCERHVPAEVNGTATPKSPFPLIQRKAPSIPQLRSALAAYGYVGGDLRGRYGNVFRPSPRATPKHGAPRRRNAPRARLGGLSLPIFRPLLYLPPS